MCQDPKNLEGLKRGSFHTPKPKVWLDDLFFTSGAPPGTRDRLNCLKLAGFMLHVIFCNKNWAQIMNLHSLRLTVRPLKMVGKGDDFSYWGPAYFQGRTVSLGRVSQKNKRPLAHLKETTLNIPEKSPQNDAAQHDKTDLQTLRFFEKTLNGPDEDTWSLEIRFAQKSNLIMGFPNFHWLSHPPSHPNRKWNLIDTILFYLLNRW